MRRIIRLDKKPYFLSYASAGGYEEVRGPRGEDFDISSDDDLFGQKTAEEAESEMQRRCLNTALKKCALSHGSLDILFAGDLENQCNASSAGLYSFGIPYVGLYSACSTCTEAILLLSLFLSTTDMTLGAAVTSSHNSAAEKQFRTPLEYGAQRPPSAQWTTTAAGAFIMSDKPYGDGKIFVDNFMVGKIVDGLSCDGANMGGSMARAAFDSIFTYFSISGASVSDFDLIVTGDLGYIGSDILKEMLAKDVSGAEKIHVDCGTLIYDKNKKNINSGASGCGCSASMLAAYFLPMLSRGEVKNILFMSTGALMNPTSVMRGNNILGIAPIINIKRGI